MSELVKRALKDCESYKPKTITFEEYNEWHLANGYKLISENQLVGCSSGCAWFRNLYEKDGHRSSVRTSQSFWMKDQRRLNKSYPTRDELFEKYRLW